MDTFYLFCAGLGGTVILLQLAAGLLGFGADHDTDHDTGADHDHDGNSFFGMLSVRTAAAALTFFGLGGLTARYYGADEALATVVAAAAAVAAFYAVAFLVRSLSGLKADGTARIERAVGRTGSVYLRVPGTRSGHGKVQVAVQNRTVEYQAVTAGPDLPTGAPVRVVAVLTADTVEVEAV
ncbi:hypothetical protein [Urbifossiella limnaea]|uniref:NfeD-like C-terminal domain-containing protein n=1 Tax=Urbifossiella limnaea TaxID=2528023 RepID=A0A517XMD2_9BACT|nr:hypothetical protein [Urbifossiella limnaea]QDU18664.1 hypothetical protein ETAA1_05570 [Urbifossiella limnaea]